MKLSIVKLVWMGTLGVLALALIAWMFEAAGEKIGEFRVSPKRSSFLILAIGTMLIAVLNSGLLHNQRLGISLSAINLSYFVAFVPFCYGMWTQATA